MVRLSTVLGFAFVTASVLIPGVLSQGLSACGNTCVQEAASTSVCNASNYNCLCNSMTFADSFGTCLGLSCSDADGDAAINTFYDNCPNIGASPTTRHRPTPKSSKHHNHATHNQPAGVLGAGFALALALVA